MAPYVVITTAAFSCRRRKGNPQPQSLMNCLQYRPSILRKYHSVENKETYLRAHHTREMHRRKRKLKYSLMCVAILFASSFDFLHLLSFWYCYACKGSFPLSLTNVKAKWLTGHCYCTRLDWHERKYCIVLYGMWFWCQFNRNADVFPAGDSSCVRSGQKRVIEGRIFLTLNLDTDLIRSPKDWELV